MYKDLILIVCLGVLAFVSWHTYQVLGDISAIAALKALWPLAALLLLIGAAAGVIFLFAAFKQADDADRDKIEANLKAKILSLQKSLKSAEARARAALDKEYKVLSSKLDELEKEKAVVSMSYQTAEDLRKEANKRIDEARQYRMQCDDVVIQKTRELEKTAEELAQRTKNAICAAERHKRKAQRITDENQF
jgi:hypothetical protein